MSRVLHAPKPPRWLGLTLDVCAVLGMAVLIKLAVHYAHHAWVHW